MLDREDTNYFNLQGSMIYDPAINEDVPLVEGRLKIGFEVKAGQTYLWLFSWHSSLTNDLVPILSFTEYWQNLLNLNQTFFDDIRRQHAEAGYTDFFNEWFTFPPKGVFPSANNSADFSSRIRSLINDAMILKEPCFDVYHITGYCPKNTWSPNAAAAFPHPLLTQFGLTDDPNLNPGDQGPYLNTTKVRELMHAPPGRDWFSGSPEPVFTNPNNATSGDGSPRSGLTVLPTVFERSPGISLVVNGQYDMLIPSNGTLFSLQNITWRGGQGFSEYPSSVLQLPQSGLNADDTEMAEFFAGYTRIEGAGRSGEQGKWVFERGVGFVDVAYAGHAVGRYNAAALFRIIEVLLGRMSVEEGLGGNATWSVDIPSPPLEFGTNVTNSNSVWG